MEKQKVVIDLETWGRGTGSGMLLDEGGKKCCLGFICEQVFESEPDDIRNRGVTPSNMFDGVHNITPEWYKTRISTAVQYNDSFGKSDGSAFTDPDRMVAIKRLFTGDDCPIEIAFSENGEELYVP